MIFPDSKRTSGPAIERHKTVTDLRGITWNHSRAYPPLIATAQRFEELNPEVRIRWEKRSLHEFGHAGVVELSNTFDLLIVDHPWAGHALAHRALVPLGDRIDADLLADLRLNSVGASFSAYQYSGDLFALPIDVAAPAACYRPDLLNPMDVPRSWEQLLDLAREGRVIISGFHVDLLLHLVMIAATIDAANLFCHDSDQWAPPDVAARSVDLLRELCALIPDDCFARNPIATFEFMSREPLPKAGACYCPFAYIYSNYARRRFAANLLRFTNLVVFEDRGMLRSVLGGAGIALSPRCKHADIALRYMEYCTSADVQCGIYLEAGGQPAHRQAWIDSRANDLTNGFFRDTLASVENAYVRPRYDGFVNWQEGAGNALLELLRGSQSPKNTLARLDELFRQSGPQNALL